MVARPPPPRNARGAGPADCRAGPSRNGGALCAPSHALRSVADYGRGMRRSSVHSTVGVEVAAPVPKPTAGSTQAV